MAASVFEASLFATAFNTGDRGAAVSDIAANPREWLPGRRRVAKVQGSLVVIPN